MGGEEGGKRGGREGGEEEGRGGVKVRGGSIHTIHQTQHV